MTIRSDKQTAIELLQELGLKEYESRTFVALARLDTGTAKDISRRSEVPRTRVYDAVSVLESKGLVEVQHSSPKQFRAVSIGEASQTLRREYQERVESLQSALGNVAPARDEQGDDTTNEVWALTGRQAIDTRTVELVDEATDELVLVFEERDMFSEEGDMFSEELVSRLETASDRGVSVYAGGIGAPVGEQLPSTLTDISGTLSETAWFRPDGGDDADITRLVLVDRQTLLVSTVLREREGHTERAICARGEHNALVAIVRRLLAATQFETDG